MLQLLDPAGARLCSAETAFAAIPMPEDLVLHQHVSVNRATEIDEAEVLRGVESTSGRLVRGNKKV